MIKVSPKRGIALIMSMMVIVVLVVVVNELSYSSKVDVFVAQNHRLDLQNRYALLSAVDTAIAYLQLDALQDLAKNSNNPATPSSTDPQQNQQNQQNQQTLEKKEETVDCLADPWAQTAEIFNNQKLRIQAITPEAYWQRSKFQQLPQEENTTVVYYTIVDESRKFNLLSLLQKDEKKEEQTDEEEQNQQQQDKNNGENGENGEEGEKDKDKQEKEKEPEVISPKDQFIRLLQLCYGDKLSSPPSEIYQGILSWLKEKKGKYKESFSQKVPIFSTKELLLADKVTPQILYGIPEKQLLGLENIITVWSEGKINVNTASFPVLLSLSSKMTPQAAKAILDYRNSIGDNQERNRFKKARDLEDKIFGRLKKQDPKLDIFREIASLVGVDSHYFTIRAFARTDRLTKEIRMVVYRSKGSVYKLYSEFEE